MRTRITVIAMLALLLAPSAALTQQARQSAADLLQAALYAQEVEGDLATAIQLFQRIIDDHPGDRPLAARALVGLAHAHETLGQSEAVAAYRRVLNDYPDQREAADRARARLAALAPAEDASPVRPEGIVARQLWVTPTGLETGALSPDGRRVAFVDWGSVKFDGVRGNADAAYYDIASGSARLVTDRPSQSYVDVYIAGAIWSPDGRTMAYTLWDTTWTHMDLYTIGADGRGDRMLVDNEQFAHIRLMDWSAAGEIAAVIKGWDELYRIALISVRDGSARIVKTVGDHAPTTLSVSPDGRYVIYEYPQAEGVQEHDLFILAADGSSETALTEHAADDQRPFFTPDGGRVVFASNRSGQNGLWAVPVYEGRGAGAPTLVRPDLGAAELLGFTRSGGLSYRIARRDMDVHIAELDLSGAGSLTAIEPITTGFVGRNGRPAWSPDGGRVAFISRRGSGPAYEPHLVVRTMTTGEEVAHRLPFPILSQDSRPVWTADAAAIMIEGGEVGAASASGFLRVSHRVDVATGEVETQPYRRSGAGNAGGVLRFVTDRQQRRLDEHGLRIAGQRDLKLFAEGDFHVPPGYDVLLVREGVKRARGSDPSRIELLTPDIHMHASELSPDGGTLAFSLPSDTSRLVSDVLYVMPVTGGTRTEIARSRPDQEVAVIRWLPDGAGLLYAAIAEENEEGEIWHVALDGSPARQLDLPIDWRQLAELDFHPDGRRVALTTTTAVTELWIMEGFPWQRHASR